MSKKILHIAGCDKFIPPFVKFVKENFDFRQHEFLLTGGIGGEELSSAQNVHFAKNSIPAKLKYYWQAMIKMNQADKVILHGLFDRKMVVLLFFMPWLLKKCYWVMWGGDLYVYQLGERNLKWKVSEFFRRPVIKGIGNLVTYIPGDVELARKWYGARGQYRECIMYLSNVHKTLEIPENKSNTLNIQVGNSADPSNNHFEVLKKLLPYKDEDICIYAPLSYGNSDYADQVIEQGKRWFGEKFIPLKDFIPFDDYLNFLGKIDVAIFNHKRQQAMGNTITLLGLGKKVYIRRDTTQWQFFEEKEMTVFDVEQLNDLKVLAMMNNEIKTKKYFSEENLLRQLIEVFK